MESLVLIDIGNTACDVLFLDGRSERGKCPFRKIGCLDALFQRHAVKKAYISSVNREGERLLSAFLSERSIPFAKPDLQVKRSFLEREGYRIGNLPILGDDLLCDLIAIDAKKPLIIFDFGTASKILALDKDRFFLGGALLPGVDAAFKTLFSDTDFIPLLGLKEDVPILSLDTEECLSSGVLYGTSFLSRGYAEKVRGLSGMAEAEIVVTGGKFALIEETWKKEFGLPYRKDPTLVLEGLARLFGLGETDFQSVPMAKDLPNS